MGNLSSCRLAVEGLPRAMARETVTVCHLPQGRLQSRIRRAIVADSEFSRLIIVRPVPVYGRNGRGHTLVVERNESHQLITTLYDRLRSLARAKMGGQAAAHTLDPTGLTNEAILRLLKCDASQIKDEQHFLALAAEAMRQILVDHARAKTAGKRGGGERPVSLSDQVESGVSLKSDPHEVLAMSEAITSLQAEDAEAATIVKMRAFAGMDCAEIAALLGLSKRTVERRWRFALAELRVRLSGGDTDSSHSRRADDPASGPTG
jgi:RNA polymerase sigma-70 factor (ECF subfamily)